MPVPKWQLSNRVRCVRFKKKNKSNLLCDRPLSLVTCPFLFLTQHGNFSVFSLYIA